MNLHCTTNKVAVSSPQYQIVKNIDVILELQRPSEDKKHTYPDIKVSLMCVFFLIHPFTAKRATYLSLQISGNISSIEITLSESQFTMLLGIWKENMLEGPNVLDEDCAYQVLFLIV